MDQIQFAVCGYSGLNHLPFQHWALHSGKYACYFLRSNPFLFSAGKSIYRDIFFSGMAQRRRGSDSYTPYIRS